MGLNSSRSKITRMNQSVVIEAEGKQSATVIFLHGLGDTGNGWLPVFNTIRQPHIKYIFPTAPIMPVTLNGGLRMNSWFDIVGLTPTSPEDEAGIKSAAEQLQLLIDDEVLKGIPRNRIVIGGFSQGGAVAVFSALAYDKAPLAGVLALSTWLPLNKEFPQFVKANQQTPMLQCHGNADPIVNIGFGQLTARALQSVLKNHELKTYPNMGHSSNDREIEDVKAFLAKHLPPV